MKRWIATVMSFLPLAAFAAGFWDGNAALQRGDSSFESGLFAVSDSFAADTVIQVENLDNGKTARLTVSQGAPSQANILVLLSPRAADALGIAAGTVARVRVTLAARAPSDLASLDQDRTSNPDPEISPAVAMAAEAAAQETPAEAPAAETSAGRNDSGGSPDRRGSACRDRACRTGRVEASSRNGSGRSRSSRGGACCRVRRLSSRCLRNPCWQKPAGRSRFCRADTRGTAGCRGRCRERGREAAAGARLP